MLTAVELRRSIEEKLERRPGLRRAISNIGWLFFDRGIRLVLGMLIAVWMTRELGPNRYGLLNWSSAWCSFFGVIAILGLDSIVVRDIVRHPEEKDRILGTAFVMKLVGGVIAVTLSVTSIAIVRPHLGADQRQVEILVGLYGANGILQAFDTIDFWYQSQVKSRYTVYAKTTSFLVMSGVRIWLLVHHAGVVALAASMLAEYALSAMGLYISYVVNHNSIRDWRYDGRWMRSLLGDSWPIVLSTFAILFQTKVDQVMLGLMIGDAEVGQFSAAIGVVDAFGVIPMVVYSTVTPTIIKAKEVSVDLYYRRLCNLYRTMFVSFVVIAGGLTIIAKPLVALCLGAKYKEAGALLAILGLRLFFVNFGTAKAAFIMTENLLRYSLATAIVGSVVNVSLNYLLIPHLRAVGSICSMMVSFLFTIFVIDFFYPPVRRNLGEMLRAIVTPWRISFD